MVGALIVVIIIVAILIFVIILLWWKQRTSKLQMSFDNIDNKDYVPEYATTEPFYSEVKKPSPPPIPDRFYLIGAYATVDNVGNNGHLELVNSNYQHNSNDQRNSLSPPPLPQPDPTPVKLSTPPNFLLDNPMYHSIDQLNHAGGGSAPSLDMPDGPGQNMLNIYAEPSRVPPPISHRVSSPPANAAPIYSESINPSHFRQARSLSPPDLELHPYTSIYDDPKPLKRSEGPKEVTAQNIREKRNLGVGQFGQVILAETVGLSLKDLRLSDSKGAISNLYKY